MSQQTSGLDDLGQRLGTHAWAAALVSGGEIVTRSNAVPAEGHLEIGSVSKGFTGQLYADALERGLVGTDDRLGQHLALEGPVADVSLASLATHRSGLPRIATDPVWARSARYLVKAQNPYGDSLRDLLAQASRTKVGRPGPMYSNLGFQLLGHAVAAASGVPYRDLLVERIATPLGLGSVHVPHSLDEVRPHAVVDAPASDAWPSRGPARRSAPPAASAPPSTTWPAGCSRCWTDRPSARQPSIRSRTSSAGCGSAPPGSRPPLRHGSPGTTAAPAGSAPSWGSTVSAGWGS